MTVTRKEILGTPWENLAGVEEHVGERIRLVPSLAVLTLLAELGAPNTFQPRTNQIIIRLYRRLIELISDNEMTAVEVERISRTAEMVEPDKGTYRGPVIQPDTQVVLAALARAGTLPSYEALDMFSQVVGRNARLDDISSSRVTDADGNAVTDADIVTRKIGGRVDDALLVLCDPMCATGTSTVKVIKTYLAGFGKPKQIVCAHLVAHRDGLKLLMDETDAVVYVFRVDANLTQKPLPPGYIIGEAGRRGGAGLGGMGEEMTNSHV